MSTKPISVGEITAQPGQTARGFLTTDVGRGVTVRMPVVVVNGTGEGPVFVVTAGVHGAEYPGIEAAIRLSRTLDPAAVRGGSIGEGAWRQGDFVASQFLRETPIALTEGANVLVWIANPTDVLRAPKELFSAVGIAIGELCLGILRSQTLMHRRSPQDLRRRKNTSLLVDEHLENLLER